MAEIRSDLIFGIRDEVSGPAGEIVNTLRTTQDMIDATHRAFIGTGVSPAFEQELQQLHLTYDAMDNVAKSAAGLRAQLEFAGGGWTDGAQAKMTQWENELISALKASEGGLQHFTETSDTEAEKVKSKWTSVAESLGGVGKALAAAAGPGVMAIGVQAVRDAEAMESVREQFRLHGASPQEIRRAEAQAAEVAAQVPGAGGQKAVMQMYLDLQRGSQHPEQLLLATAQAQAALTTLGGNQETAITGLGSTIRAAQTLGISQDPAAYRAWLDQYVRGQQVLSAAGKLGTGVSPNYLDELVRSSKGAGFGFSPEFYQQAALLSSMSGGTAAVGRGAQTLVGELSGAKISGKAVGELLGLGLVDEDQVKRSKKGEIEGLKPGEAIHGWDVAQKNPLQFLTDYFMPAMAAKGLTEAEQHALVQRAFPGGGMGGGQAAALVEKMIADRALVEQATAHEAAAPGLKAGEGPALSPIKALGDMTTALREFSAAVASPSVVGGIDALRSMTGKITSWAGDMTKQWQGFQKANPDLATVMSGGAVAGTLVGGGVMTGSLVGMLRSGFGLGPAATQLQLAGTQLQAAAAALGGGGTAGAAGMAGAAGATGSVLGLGAAIVTLGTAAATAGALITGLYSLMRATDPLGREGRQKLDEEILKREGRQPGGPNEKTINPFATGDWQPWIKDLFGGRAAAGGPETPASPEQARAAAGGAPIVVPFDQVLAAAGGADRQAGLHSIPISAAPGGNIGGMAPMITPSLPWPAPAAAGATGGPNVHPYIDAATGGLDLGARVAGPAGAGFGAAFTEALGAELSKAEAIAAAVAQRIIGHLTFSAHPDVTPSGEGGDQGTPGPSGFDSLRGAHSDYGITPGF